MNLSSMTVSQLRELASELDISGRSKMKKAELIAAIEYAEAPSVDNIPGGIYDHAAAVAQMRANIDAEEEEKAAARRARNRCNYAPATEPVIENDEATDTTDFTAMNREEIRAYLTAAIGDDYLSDDDREALVLDFEDRDAVTVDEFWEIVGSVLDPEEAPAVPEVNVTLKQLNSRIATATMPGRNASVRRQGRFWVLRDLSDGTLTQVKATTLAKLGRRWANRVGVWADQVQALKV